MGAMKDFLSQEIFWGNPPILWVKALMTAGLLFALYTLLKIIGIKGYKNLKKHGFQELSYRFVFYSFLRKLNVFVAFVCAIYPAIYHLSFPLKLAKLSRKIFIIFIFFQILIWVINAINLYSKKYFYEKFQRDPTSVTAASVVTLIAKIFASIIVALLMLDQMGVNITALLAGLGVGGIAVALALQNILGDIFASLTIVLDKPFKVGDTLFINNSWGVVEKVGLKTTRIRSLDGNLMVVPNNLLLQNQIQNYSEIEERRTVQNIGVKYETSYEKVQKIPEILAKAVQSVPQTRLERVTFANYGDFSLIFELAYYAEQIENRSVFDVRHKVNLEILRLFNENGIQFAYPTQTLYLNKT